MKSVLLILSILLVTLSSCRRPNPLDPYVGVWAVQQGRSQQIESRDFFYINITKEQIESGNLQLVGNHLIIKKAELCCPFLQGKQGFGFFEWTDSILTTWQELPVLHYPESKDRLRELKLVRLKPNTYLRPQRICMKSISLDSISHINYIIEIDDKHQVFRQTYTHEPFSEYKYKPVGKLKTRKLSKNEIETFNTLKNRLSLDTLNDKDKPYLGCHMGNIYVKSAYSYQNKVYKIQLNRSNLAMHGFLFTIATRGNWKESNLKHDFISGNRYSDRPKELLKLYFNQ